MVICIVIQIIKQDKLSREVESSSSDRSKTLMVLKFAVSFLAILLLFCMDPWSVDSCRTCFSARLIELVDNNKIECYQLSIVGALKG